MSQTHRPDRWVILKIGENHKVFGMWYGGYLGADNWRLSRPIESVERRRHHLVTNPDCESSYKCHFSSEGLSGYGSEVLKYEIKRLWPDAEIVNAEDFSI